MTYATGGPIQATDYNTFATLANGMNQVYADLYPGSVPTTLGTYTPTDPCTYGYGQTPTLSTVIVNHSILASEWSALFDTMRSSGTHQGTTVVPPLPGSDPVVGNNIVAFNTPTTFSSVVSSLNTNRFNLALGQSTLTSGSNLVQSSGVWTTKLTFTCQVDFLTWDKARYFFNSGGYLSFTGSYSPVVTPEDATWAALLTSMSTPTILEYGTTKNGVTTTGPGFYALTNSYKILYTVSPGSGTYSSNTLVVSAKYNSAGANGKVDIKIEMNDFDVTPNVKNGLTTFQINTRRSSDAVVIANPTVGSVTFVSTP